MAWNYAKNSKGECTSTCMHCLKKYSHISGKRAVANRRACLCEGNLLRISEGRAWRKELLKQEREERERLDSLPTDAELLLESGFTKAQVETLLMVFNND